MATATKNKPKSKARKTKTVDFLPPGANGPANMIGIPLYGYSYYDWDWSKYRVYKSLNSAVLHATEYLRDSLKDDLSNGVDYGDCAWNYVEILQNGNQCGSVYMTRDLKRAYYLPERGKIAYPIMASGGISLLKPINRAALSKLMEGYIEGFWNDRNA